MNHKIFVALTLALLIPIAVGVSVYEFFMVPTIPVNANNENLTVKYYIEKPEANSGQSNLKVTVQVGLIDNSPSPIIFESYFGINDIYVGGKASTDYYDLSTQAQFDCAPNVAESGWKTGFLIVPAEPLGNYTNPQNSKGVLNCVVKPNQPQYYRLTFGFYAPTALFDASGNIFNESGNIPDGFNFQPRMPVSLTFGWGSISLGGNLGSSSIATLVQSQEPLF